MSSKPERAYPNSVEERRSFQSIKYQFTPDPNSFLLITYLRGKIHIAHFQLYQTKTYQTKNEKFQRLRSKKSEEVIPHTELAVYIYIYICSVYIQYILLSRTEL